MKKSYDLKILPKNFWPRGTIYFNLLHKSVFAYEKSRLCVWPFSRLQEGHTTLTHKVKGYSSGGEQLRT